MSCTMEDTQNGAFYKAVRDAAMLAINPGAFVLSFGWNSSGMGKARDFELREVMLVAHGGAHNDTICIAEEYCPKPKQMSLCEPQNKTGLLCDEL